MSSPRPQQASNFVSSTQCCILSRRNRKDKWEAASSPGYFGTLGKETLSAFARNAYAAVGGKCLNIFWTSLSSFLVFFSGLPERSLLDVPLQINCRELALNILMTSVPTL